MTKHKVGTQEEWSAARKELLEKEYTFDTEHGKKTLADLFDGRSQLLIYHLMFGPTYEAACPGCTGLADHLDAALVHLNNRDVTLICISRAPIEKLQAYKPSRKHPTGSRTGLRTSEPIWPPGWPRRRAGTSSHSGTASSTSRCAATTSTNAASVGEKRHRQ